MGNLYKTLVPRLAWGLLSLACLTFFALAASGLFSDLYTSLAKQRRLESAASSFTLRASELATHTAPWKSEAWFEYAISAAQVGDYELAVRGMGQSISWSSADAQKWAVMARILAMKGEFDSPMKAAITRAIDLAPNAPNWRRQIALDGTYWWRKGDADMRRMWLDSMRLSLKLDLGMFLSSVVLTHREDSFCEDVGQKLKLKSWCEWTAFARSACYQKEMHPDQRKYCDQYGFHPLRNP